MTQKMMITGSLGFIPSNFIRRATYEKHPFTYVSVDKVNNGSSINSIYLNKGHSFYIGDITDAHFMNVLFEYERPDIVLHMAAETFVDYSLTDPSKFIHNNVVGTQEVINACVKWKVKKLVYVSTDEIYGQLEKETDPSWTETSSLDPRNPYSASKACAEMLVKAAYHSYGLEYNIIRPSNNYGPRQTKEKLIPKVISQIIKKEKIPVYGEGLQIRDWTHVFDNCTAILTILNSNKTNETYNISANQEYTNIEVVQKICNAMESGHDLIEFIKDPRGNAHDFRYSVNCDKIKKELGWKSNYKFNDGIISTIEWYKKNAFFLK